MNQKSLLLKSLFLLSLTSLTTSLQVLLHEHLCKWLLTVLTNYYFHLLFLLAINLTLLLIILFYCLNGRPKPLRSSLPVIRCLLKDLSLVPSLLFLLYLLIF